jgi:hypothetical protein
VILRKLATLPLMFVLAVSTGIDAKQTRDSKQVAAFKRENPCPANGKRRGPCPDHVVDHIIPLCASGPDLPSNMQWQTRAAAKLKDREEKQQCAKKRKG